MAINARKSAIFPLEQVDLLKRRLSVWAAQFETAVYLDSHERVGAEWECLVGVARANAASVNPGNLNPATAPNAASVNPGNLTQTTAPNAAGVNPGNPNPATALNAANVNPGNLNPTTALNAASVNPGNLAQTTAPNAASVNPGNLTQTTAPNAASVNPGNLAPAFEQLKSFQTEKQDWLFGFFAYDLKNEIERLHSHHIDHLGFPDLYFFQPDIVVGIRQNQLEIHSLNDDPEALYKTILQTQEHLAPAPSSPLPMRARMPKAAYLSTVEAIRRHIVEGDLYEMNLCQEFYATEAQIDPFSVFTELNQLSKAPFSAYLRIRDRYLLCASPERFLQKKGQKLLSQPIKGTRKRGATPESDAQIRRELAESEKDRAENVMIVDLVRNDLAKCCEPGSVKVESLFGIHSFEMVHQMISTVSGQLRPGVHPLDALRGAFPMGSMTGAPKVMAMELIEQYECSRRGLYSGAVGYFTPGGDFDFNVVIRSILYNESARYCAIQVGGAIVYDSVPEQEYEECMVKAGAMLRVLNGVLDHDQDFI